MNRNLDGVYFRVERNNKFQDICFSDMTDSEQDDVLKDKNEVWLRNMCRILAKSIRNIGDQLDIVCGAPEQN